MNGDQFTAEKNFEIDVRSVDHRWNMGNFHYHNSYEIYYLLRGSRKMLIENRVYNLLPGDIILLKPDILHRSMDSGPHTRINIVFNKSFMSEFFSETSSEYLTYSFNTEFIRFTKNENITFKKLFEQISYEYNNNKMLFVTLACILNIILKSSERIKKEFDSNIFSGMSEKVNIIVKFINENYMTINSTDEIADACFINKSYMCRLFKKETGLTVFEYMNNVKINKACELMRNTDNSLTNIALQCGFSCSSYFSYAFKEIMKRTPSEYRKEIKRLIQ